MFRDPEFAPAGGESVARAGDRDARRARLDFAVDLGARIGSPEWLCGATTLAAGIATLLALSPGIVPLPALPAAPPPRVASPMPVAQVVAPVRPVAPRPIAVARAASAASDTTPIRISREVGFSLYRAAREAGVPLPVIADYLRAIGQRIDVGGIRPYDRIDLVIGRRRAATGAIEPGRLLYAGLTRAARRIDLLRWNGAWYDADGLGARRDGGFAMPVARRLTSGFGMRFHPILGYGRMHQGVDLAAPYGEPIVAASDGVVRFAGWHGGHGAYVLLAHANGLATGYGHMSRIVAAPGAAVRQGELIGYVGSSGLSTGPHLHFEVFRDGMAIDPATASFDTTPRVASSELPRFKAEMARLTAVKARAAL